MSTPSTVTPQSACLYFRGVPKEFQDVQIRQLIHTFMVRMYAKAPQASSVEERFARINNAITRITILRRIYNNTSVAGYLFFNDQSIAREALKLLRYQVVDDSVPGSPEIHVMWREDDKTRRQTGKGNVFIRNLHDTITARMLCQAFEPVGRVLSVRISRGQSGKSNCYGYVQFDTASAANDAIEKTNGKYLLGRQVTVEHFVPMADRSKEPSKFCNVFIRNLPAEMTAEGLKELCEKHIGKVTSTYTAVDPRKNTEGGTGRMFGAANFETHEDAVKALDMLPKIEFEDKEIIYCCQHKSKQAREQIRLRRKKEQEETYYRSNRNVRVEKMGPEITQQQVQDAFGVCGTITSVRVYKNARINTSHGYVLFESADEARRAVTEMNGKTIAELGANPITVELARQKTSVNKRPTTYGNLPQHGHYPPQYQGYQMQGYPNMPFPNQGARMQAPQKAPVVNVKQVIGNKIYKQVITTLGARSFTQDHSEKLARKVTGILIELSEEDLRNFESDAAQLNEGIEAALKKLKDTTEYSAMFPLTN